MLAYGAFLSANRENVRGTVIRIIKEPYSDVKPSIAPRFYRDKKARRYFSSSGPKPVTRPSIRRLALRT